MRGAAWMLAAVLAAATVAGIVAQQPARAPNAAVTSATTSTTSSTSSTPTTSPTTTTPSTHGTGGTGGGGGGGDGGAASVPLGVYAGPGDVGAAESFSEVVGRPVRYALDYLDDSSWQSISDPQWLLDHWVGSGLDMIWAVPMLPAYGGTLAQGASGAYNGEFQLLAENMVASGQGSSVLMLGWSPTSSDAPWSVSTSAEAAQYTAYWQQIVETMRAVPGAHFAFEWDAGQVGGVIPSYEAYPGDDYVDIIATEAFDNTTPRPGTTDRWDAVVSGSYGPGWASSFAARHHKAFMIAEAGCDPDVASGGGGDDPAFVQDLLTFSAAQHATAVVIWDFGTAAITSPQFQDSLATLRSPG
jgi:hypothetical protein